MIERNATLQLELIVDDLETAIRYLERLDVAGIRITDREGANHCAGRILGNRAAAQHHRGLRFVHVTDVDRKGLLDLVTTCIRRSDCDVDCRFAFMIERYAAL